MLSERERQIMEIISNDPMVSQDEIAAALGITRSSVSVHIMNLVRAGVIRGRGYIIADEEYDVVIGAANADLMLRFKDEKESALERDSHFWDVDFDLSYGGIAKNISENLTRLGANPRPIFAVGSGLLDRELLQECRDEFITTDHVLQSADTKTTAYIEMIYQNGHRQVALSNFEIEELISPTFLLTKQKLLSQALSIVLEDGLSADTLKFVVSNFPKNRPVLVTTYRERIPKYRDLLSLFSCAQFSAEIALELAGLPADRIDDESVTAAARRLHALGLQTMVIPYADAGCYLVNRGKGILVHCGSKSNGSALYDHYRDSIIAPTVIGLQSEQSDEELLRNIAAVRYISGSTEKFIHKALCTALVESTREQLDFQFRRFDL